MPLSIEQWSKCGGGWFDKSFSLCSLKVVEAPWPMNESKRGRRGAAPQTARARRGMGDGTGRAFCGINV
jgi:hypothetical protein